MVNNFSINTNVGATIALASLNNIQTNLNKVQNQVSTGLKVAGATDNAAVFSVAQGIRANLASYDAVSTALNDGQSAVTVALAGTTSVSNLIQGISSTLTSLSDGTITDAQRQSYTVQLKSQIDEVQTFLQGATFNGINLVNANEGTYQAGGAGFVSFSSQPNVSVLSGLGGAQLTIHAQDLTGQAAGTDGFLGLARLVYYVATNTSGVTSTSLDTQSSAYLGYAGGASALVSRSEIYQNEAIAALAAVSNSTNAFISSGGTAGINSVFGAAVANFQAQVSTALGSLGADNANIQAQVTFVQSLSDANNTGLGNLVDANLATASAQLTALQTQQQLATQALSIANSQPQNILNLFKNA